MCTGVTYDDSHIILLYSPFPHNKASNDNDRCSPGNTEDVLKHSKPAVVGREGSGCWVDRIERLTPDELQFAIGVQLHEKKKKKDFPQ